MNGVPPLEFAGVSHWAALAALLAAGACILELGQSYKKTVRNRTTFWLGAACLFSLVPDLAAMLADEPEKNWTWMLPLHFCSVMQVVCALSLWIPSRRLRSVAYYCVLCATLQGLVTPSVAHDFPSWTYFAFFLSHGVTVITALYLPLALEWKPARWDFLWAFCWRMRTWWPFIPSTCSWEPITGLPWPRPPEVPCWTFSGHGPGTCCGCRFLRWR